MSNCPYILSICHLKYHSWISVQRLTHVFSKWSCHDISNQSAARSFIGRRKKQIQEEWKKSIHKTFQLQIYNHLSVKFYQISLYCIVTLINFVTGSEPASSFLWYICKHVSTNYLSNPISSTSLSMTQCFIWDTKKDIAYFLKHWLCRRTNKWFLRRENKWWIKSLWVSQPKEL